MNGSPVLVLTAPGDRDLPLMAELRQIARVVVGDSLSDFLKRDVEAEIILNWSGTLSLLQEAFRTSHGVRWVHSRSAGLEHVLFPELIESEVILTNGS